MTVTEVAHQLFNMSVGGYFNHEKFTEARLRDYITAMTRTGGTAVMEIALPDGWWFFEVRQMPEFGRGFYEYHIPEDREQEKAVLDRLMAK